MADVASFLDETLEAWRDIREGIIDEVENIPADKFHFRPTPEVRSVTEVVQHILEVSMMMTEELTRPDTNLKRKPWPALLALYAKPAHEATTKAALLRVLRSSGPSLVPASLHQPLQELKRIKRRAPP